MKRLFGLLLAGMLVLSVFSASALAGGDMAKVMTRNQYLGADLAPVVLAQKPEEFMEAATDALNIIAANNFPLRAKRLAKEVALTKPDLIGLQEVYDFTLDGKNLGPPFVNHLDATLSALKDEGQAYVVGAISNNLSISIPITGFGEVGMLDRDVILVRKGVDFKPLAGDYKTGGLCGVPSPNPAFEFQSTPSEDGCNYTFFATVHSPIGVDIPIKRGFVGLDATVRGKKYRFVNTHLEERQPDPTDPGSAILQSLQAVELVGTLLSTTPPDRKLILLGDFNSWSEDLPIAGITPPYQIIVGAGFSDVWKKNPLALFNPKGLTCCQLPDLSNKKSDLYERIDNIFVRTGSFLPLALVTGQLPMFPLNQPPNWDSDHFGVFAEVFFK